MDAYIIGTTSKAISSGGTINGNLTISGDLTVSGGGSLAFDEILEGAQVIDITNSEAFLVRKNGDGGDVFTINTSTVGATLLGALTIGSDGAGHDVVFNSGTSGDNFTWDASEECLIITGTDAAQALKVADGDLVVVDKIYLYDNDGGEYLHGSSDGHLEINAGTTLDITAPTVDLNSATEFNIDTAAYDLNASGAVTIDSAGVSIDSSSASNLTTSSGALTITSAAAATWSTAAGNLTLDSAAGSLVLDGHTGAQVISSNSGEVDITSAANVDINATTTVTVDGTGVSIDGTDDSNLTVTGSNKDLAVSVAGGSTQTLTISSAGTGTNAIDINATAGGVDIDANGAISLDSAAGSIDMNVVDGQTVAIGLNGAVETLWKPHGTAGNELWSTINTAGTTDGSDAAGSILLSAVAGGIGLAWADGKDLWAEGGRFVVTANEDAADAIKLHADAGTSQTIQIVNDAGTTDGSDDAGAIELSAAAGGIGLAWADDKDLWAEGGRAVITANEDAADAIKLHADAGTSQTITIVNDAGTGAAAIGLTASAGGVTVGLGGGAGDDFIVDTTTLVVESDNNRVGIGTAAPSTLLETIGTGIQVTASPVLIVSRHLAPSGTKGINLGYDSGAVMGVISSNAATSGIRFDTHDGSSWGERMRIHTDGNVGIGSTSPKTIFHAVGATGNPATSGTTPTAIARFDSTYNSVLDIGQHTSPYAMWIQAHDKSNLAQYYNLSLQPDGGNVGIGIATPTSPLDIVKSVSGFDVDGHLAIQNTNSTNGDYAGMGFSTHSNTGDGNIKSWFGVVRVDGYGENDFVFLHDTADDNYAVGSSEEVMRITSDGYVGINNDKPGEELSVNGQAIISRIDISGSVNAVSDGEVLELLTATASKYGLLVRHHDGANPRGIKIHYSDGSGFAADDYAIYYTDTDGAHFTVGGDGSATITGSGTAVTSDRRIKTDIVDATSKLDDINKLKVRNFDYIYNDGYKSGKKHIGFIADEFEEVFPSLVTEVEQKAFGTEYTDLKRIMDSALVPILIKAVQELSAKVEALENK